MLQKIHYGLSVFIINCVFILFSFLLCIFFLSCSNFFINIHFININKLNSVFQLLKQYV